MEINLDLYKVFYEVATHKNISKTAELMHISQPAVTQSIKKLESLLGLPLFYRKNNGVELTDEGKILFEHIKNSIEIISNSQNIFSQYMNLDKGKIRIGGWDTLINTLLMPILKEFIKKYPNIEIQTFTGKTAELMQKLENGELDILICNLPENTKSYKDINFIPIKNARYCFFATKTYIKDHKVKDIKKLKSNQLILPNKMTTRGKILEKFCKDKGINTLEGNYVITTIELMKCFVLNDIGVGFTNVEDIKDLLKEDKVKIIKEIENENVQEGFAVLKKELMNTCTYQFLKDIKKFYNI